MTADLIAHRERQQGRQKSRVEPKRSTIGPVTTDTTTRDRAVHA
jgi:hypothetical protein